MVISFAQEKREMRQTSKEEKKKKETNVYQMPTLFTPFAEFFHTALWSGYHYSHFNRWERRSSERQLHPKWHPHKWECWDLNLGFLPLCPEGGRKELLLMNPFNDTDKLLCYGVLRAFPVKASSAVWKKGHGLGGQMCLCPNPGTHPSTSCVACLTTGNCPHMAASAQGGNKLQRKFWSTTKWNLVVVEGHG